LEQPYPQSQSETNPETGQQSVANRNSDKNYRVETASLQLRWRTLLSAL